MITITMPIWASYIWYLSWVITAAVAVINFVRLILSQRRQRERFLNYKKEYDARPAGANWPSPGPDTDQRLP